MIREYKYILRKKINLKDVLSMTIDMMFKPNNNSSDIFKNIIFDKKDSDLKRALLNISYFRSITTFFDDNPFCVKNNKDSSFGKELVKLIIKKNIRDPIFLFEMLCYVDKTNKNQIYEYLKQEPNNAAFNLILLANDLINDIGKEFIHINLTPLINIMHKENNSLGFLLTSGLLNILNQQSNSLTDISIMGDLDNIISGYSKSLSKPIKNAIKNRELNPIVRLSLMGVDTVVSIADFRKESEENIKNYLDKHHLSKTNIDNAKGVFKINYNSPSNTNYICTINSERMYLLHCRKPGVPKSDVFCVVNKTLFHLIYNPYRRTNGK